MSELEYARMECMDWSMQGWSISTGANGDTSTMATPKRKFSGMDIRVDRQIDGGGMSTCLSVAPTCLG